MGLITAISHPRPRRLSLLSRLQLAVTLRRDRRHLGELDKHLLKDIGLTESEARTEAERPFWDVPQHWLR